MSLQDEIRRAQELGQRLEDLVVNAGQITIKAEGSQLLIGFWSLICDYQKGLLNLLHWKFFAAAFALWRPIIEATIRAHLSLMLPKEDLDRLKKDKYRVDFKKVPSELDEAFGLGHVFQDFLPERVRNAHEFKVGAMKSGLVDVINTGMYMSQYNPEQTDKIIGADPNYVHIEDLLLARKKA